MSTDTTQHEPASHADASTRRAGWLVLISAAFLALQVGLTDHGSDGPGAAVFWFAVGAVLLWFVHRRRSALARLVVIVLSFVGAAIFAAASLSDPPSALIALAYVGQAVPLMLGPVRRHVASRRAAIAPSPHQRV